MMRAGAAAAIVAGLMLAACTTTPTAQVVRFHNNQPPINQPGARGTIAIVPADPAKAGSLEWQVQSQPIAAELTRAGFTVVQSGPQAQFIATVDIGATDRMAPPRQSGLTIGVGGGFSSGNVGIGTNVRVPVGGQPQPQTITATTLNVQIIDQASKTAIWEGRATQNGQSTATGTAATTQLASVLFRDFPGPSGVSATVPLG